MHAVAVFGETLLCYETTGARSRALGTLAEALALVRLEFLQRIICTSSVQGIPVLEHSHCRISFRQWFGDFFVDILSSCCCTSPGQPFLTAPISLPAALILLPAALILLPRAPILAALILLLTAQILRCLFTA